MGYRLNERNAGHWTVDGEPKKRRAKARATTLTESDKELVAHVLDRVIDSMAFDPDVSERGHLHPDAKFTDGGRFILCLTRSQFEQLGQIFQKIENG